MKPYTTGISIQQEEPTIKGPWVMTSRRVERGLAFYIGAIEIARISYYGRDNPVLLSCHGCDPTEHENVSAAMRRMHELLRSPSPEDAT